MRIVLIEPEIPQNTGNIARTCAATGSVLHLVEPLGFSIDESRVKRAGLDYWHLLELHVHPSWEACDAALGDGRRYFMTTKAKRRYDQARFAPQDCLIFGRETRGLPEDLLLAHPDDCLRIPMLGDARSLNLSNAVAVALYEALRQQDFSGLVETGKFAVP